jgi:hypothetical protein
MLVFGHLLPEPHRATYMAVLKADAACSVTCAYMSLTLLADLLLNRPYQEEV